MKFTGIILPAFISALAFSSCGTDSGRAETKKSDTADLSRLNFAVERAPEWDNVFIRKSGWFGGDGIFALTRKGKESAGSSKSDETIIWFSDTMIGEIEGDSLQPGSLMINNSVALVQNGKPDSTIRFFWDKSGDDEPASVFVPKTPATEKGDYYWLGDGFVNHARNNDIFIFGYRIRTEQGNNTFGFREVGNTLIRIPAGSQPPFANKTQTDIPFFLGRNVDSTGSFGAGVLVNTKEAGVENGDGFIYVYGVRGKNKGVMVARVMPADLEDFSKWAFWNGTKWSNDPADIQTVTDRASNELSVSRLEDGRYILVFQTDGIGKSIGIRLGASPVGPFGPLIPVYDVSADLEKDKDIFPYNAKAHPVLSQPGELLISYNVNSFDFFNDIKVFPHLYRPRFIRLKYEVD